MSADLRKEILEYLDEEIKRLEPVCADYGQPGMCPIDGADYCGQLEMAKTIRKFVEEPK